VIICGLGGLGLRTAEQLTAVGIGAVVLDEAADPRRVAALATWGVTHIARAADSAAALVQAGLDGASAVVCAEESDLRTLETALLVRDLRPEIRVVVHLDNAAIGNAVASVTGEGSVLDVAGLFAPSVIEECLGRNAHELELGGERFVAVSVSAPRDGSLRSLYGDLAPIGVLTGPDERLVVCPGRDEPVRAGDRVTLLGTREAVAAAGIHASAATDAAGGARDRRLADRVAGGLHAAAGATDRAVRATLLVGLLGMIVSTLVLVAGYVTDDGGHMRLLQAVYFSFETAATVGFGDFSFAHQSAAMQVFGIALIAFGTAVVSLLFAFITNALISQRIEQSLGRGRLRGIGGHVVVIGLGSIGMRVLEGLVASGTRAAVIERDEDNRYIAQARALGVPVVVGDATLAPTLAAVHLGNAAAVAVMTSDDLANLETGLAARGLLGERWHETPVILRVFDRSLGGRLQHSFGFQHVWSTSALAAPWFVGAAIGFGVVSTFYVGNRPFLIARLRVRAGGGLDGVEMRELSARVRVMALARAADGGRLEHPPRRDTRFAAGDEAYLVGPSEELLPVVRRERGR
jgi:Trk K+ transport system NAD-binding subunit